MTTSEETIFQQALDQDPQERAAYLQQACGENVPLRQRVESLLSAYDEGAFLESPAAALEALSAGAPDCLALGTEIGPYKLLEQIGEGGMGIVYVAEQKQPIKRQVALKVIKPGMDTRQVVARFEAERQALAIMDHPHIARVIDAGTTDQGRPFFVMELVRGVPITEFCDAERLTIRERLKLFCQVCEAVQHAHQKGIIHRDLKPSNVLVTRLDEEPIPKVIDFGVAKAVNQSLADEAIHTRFAQLLGTPLYMSPEQAQLDGQDIDTRSDIYSLGVLLYELLTGTTPFATETLRAKGLDEFRRIVREEEPAQPSERISTLQGNAGSTISQRRSVDPRRLKQLMRGELDWIALRCLEKDRTRRYQSASDLADDIGRFLANEVVKASPPSKLYRWRKFAYRNRGALTAATIAITALLAATGVSLWQVRLANAARVLADERLQSETNEKEHAKQSAADARAVLEFFENRVLAAARPAGEEGGLGIDATICDAIEAAESKIAAEFVDRPLVEASLRHTLGRTYLRLGEPKRAIQQFERSRELYAEKLGPHHADTLIQSVFLAGAFKEAGRIDEAQALYEVTLVNLRKHLGPDNSDSLSAEGSLAMLQLDRGEVEEATQILARLREQCERVLGPDHETTHAMINNLSQAYSKVGKHQAAIALIKSEFSKTKAKLGESHSSTLISANNLAFAYKMAGQTAEAQVVLETTLKAAEGQLGPSHPQTLEVMNNLGCTYQDADRFDLAVPLLERALAGIRQRRGDHHPDTILIWKNLAFAYRGAGNLELAVPLLEVAYAGLSAQVGSDHADTRTVVIHLIELYLEAGELEKALAVARERVAQGNINDLDLFLRLGMLAKYFEEAKRFGDLEPLWRETLEVARREFGWRNFSTQACLNHLIKCYKVLDQPAEVEALWRDVIRELEIDEPHSDEHAHAIYNLAHHLLNQWRVDEAHVLAEQAWQMVQVAYPDDWRTYQTQALVGACLLAKKDYPNAKLHLSAGYRGMRERYKTFPGYHLIEPLDWLAQLCVATEDWERAVEAQYYADDLRRRWKR